MRLLLGRNADVLAVQEGRSTALHLAALKGHKTVVELLMGVVYEAKGTVDLNNIDGATPLHSAVLSGALEIVELLLKRAKVNIVTKAGNSPLHYAVREGYLDIVRTLVEAGADASIRNIYGSTPIDCASKERLNVVVRELLVRSLCCICNTPLAGPKFNGLCPLCKKMI